MVTDGADRLRGSFSKSPLSFDGLAGRGALLSHLRRHVRENAAGLCLLFHGQKGVGKSLIASLFARAISCEQPTAAGASCNQCVSCRDFERGSALGYAYIDVAAGNEEDVKEKMSRAALLAGGTSLVRVVIQIDNTDKCSQEIFDVLLKTLEDRSAIFLLTATKYDLIRPAVRSRAIAYRVGPLGREEAVFVIGSLFSDNGVRSGDGVIELLGAMSQGVPSKILELWATVSGRAGLTLRDIRDVFDLNWPDEIADSRALRLAAHDLVKDPAVFAPKHGAGEGARRLRSTLVQIGMWEASKPSEASSIADPAFFRLDEGTKAALLADFYDGCSARTIGRRDLWS